MPLTRKGNKIMERMRSEYGPKKGASVFYASRNAGRIQGVDPESMHGEHSAKPDASRHAHRRLVHARRSMEDHFREQEDALLGDGEPDEQENEHETEKHGKLGSRRGKY